MARRGRICRLAQQEPPQGPHGHTLMEILLVVLLFGVVSAAVYAVLMSQRHFYTTHVQVADTRDATRLTAEVLSLELRAQSPAAGDLYAIAADSVALRSTTGFGVVCSSAAGVVGLWLVSGFFGDQPTDSVLIFGEYDFQTRLDDAWMSSGIAAVRRRPASGRCPDGRPPQIELALTSSYEGVTVGSPVRGFRSHIYKLYRGGDGSWWLGQRLRSGRMQPLAGPFLPPREGGLQFDFLDSLGVPTEDPAAVAQVRVSFRTRSARPIPRPTGPGDFSDTLSAVVFLRNS